MKTQIVIEEAFGLREITEELYKRGFDWIQAKTITIKKIGELGAEITFESLTPKRGKQ